MMKRFVVIVAVLFWMPTTVFCETEWTLTGVQDGISTYTRKAAGRSLDEMKAVGAVDAPLAALEALFRDIPALADYLYLCSGAEQIAMEKIAPAADRIPTYIRMDMPWPVSDRDAVGLICFYFDPPTGRLVCRGECVDPYLVPAVRGIIRMPRGIPTFVLEPVAADRTMVTFVLSADPGGDLPPQVVNLVMNNMGYKTIMNIRRMIGAAKYLRTGAPSTATIWNDGERWFAE